MCSTVRAQTITLTHFAPSLSRFVITIFECQSMSPVDGFEDARTSPRTLRMVHMLGRTWRKDQSGVPSCASITDCFNAHRDLLTGKPDIPVPHSAIRNEFLKASVPSWGS
jgi:hypothetical protein